MQIVAFALSPRRHANTEQLLDHAIAGCRSAGHAVEKIVVENMSVAPCRGCGRCTEGGRCIIEDDFQDVYDKLRDCDGALFASPLYFMNVPAKGKALIDRCQSFWTAKHVHGEDLFGGRRRYCLLISCAGAGAGRGGADVFRGLKDTMYFLCDALGMTMLPPLAFPRVDSAGSIEDVPGAFEKAKQRGADLFPEL